MMNVFSEFTDFSRLSAKDKIQKLLRFHQGFSDMEPLLLRQNVVMEDGLWYHSLYEQ